MDCCFLVFKITILIISTSSLQYAYAGKLCDSKYPVLSIAISMKMNNVAISTNVNKLCQISLVKIFSKANRIISMTTNSSVIDTEDQELILYLENQVVLHEDLISYHIRFRKSIIIMDNHQIEKNIP